MPSLITRIMAATLMVLAAGCSKSGDESWEKSSASSMNSLDHADEDFQSSLKKFFLSYLDFIPLGEDLFQHEPLAADILRQEIPAEKLKRYDRDQLKEKAKQIQQSANAAGIHLNQDPLADKKSIREIGRRFGLSDERIAELEAMAATKEKNTNTDPSAPSAPATGMAAHTLAQTKSHSDTPTVAPVVPDPPKTTAPQIHSTEMLEIIQRREERLRKAMKVNPNP
ncbi:MAG: hypothetical protein HQL81_16650 [Magnetococcales bacterium]|nr:hypothetical protein [Magnetococcales bacterium]